MIVRVSRHKRLAVSQWTCAGGTQNSRPRRFRRRFFRCQRCVAHATRLLNTAPWTNRPRGGRSIYVRVPRMTLSALHNARVHELRSCPISHLVVGNCAHRSYHFCAMVLADLYYNYPDSLSTNEVSLTVWNLFAQEQAGSIKPEQAILGKMLRATSTLGCTEAHVDTCLNYAPGLENADGRT